MIAGLVVGGFLLLGGILIRPRPRPGELWAQGTVADSWSGYALGEPTWLSTVEFQDAKGTTWRFQPPLTSGRRRTVGTPVDVSYLPDDPQGTARKRDGLDGYLPWLLMGLGVAIVLAAVALGQPGRQMLRRW